MAKKSNNKAAPTTPSKPDTSGYESEKRHVESQQKEAEAKKAANNEKIARLEIAKSDIEDRKEEVNRLYKNIKNSYEQKDYWKGTKYTSYDNFMESDFLTNYKSYYDGMDTYLDAICDKITQLKNENNEQDGILGWLSSRWNDLTNTINKLLN